MKASIKILALMLMMITSCDMNTRLSTTELTEQVQEHILEKWEELYTEEELDEVELKSLYLYINQTMNIQEFWKQLNMEKSIHIRYLLSTMESILVGKYYINS